MKPFLVVVVILSLSMDRVLPALHVLVSPYELFILGASLKSSASLLSLDFEKPSVWLIHILTKLRCLHDVPLLCNLSPSLGLRAPAQATLKKRQVQIYRKYDPILDPIQGPFLRHSRRASATCKSDNSTAVMQANGILFKGINVQDILKLKVCLHIHHIQTLPQRRLNFKSAAINTIFGVSMTTRRQMLKIKVSLAHIWAHIRTYLYSNTLTGHVGSQSGKDQSKYCPRCREILRLTFTTGSSD